MSAPWDGSQEGVMEILVSRAKLDHDAAADVDLDLGLSGGGGDLCPGGPAGLLGADLESTTA